MMIKYTQLAPAYDEYPVTGVNARWQPGQLSDVTGARLTALLATGLFADVELGTQEVPITATTSDQGVTITAADVEIIPAGVVMQGIADDLPDRPNFKIVHWYAHDLVDVNLLYPMDQFFPSGPLALFRRGQDGACYDAKSIINSGGPGYISGPISSFVDKGERLNHATGSSGTRPTLGARVNLLQTTATLSAWFKSFGGSGNVPIVTPNADIAPDGTSTAVKISFDCGDLSSSTNRSYIRDGHTSVSGVKYKARIWIKAATPADVGKNVRLLHENSVEFAATLVNIPAEWTLIERTVTRSGIGTGTNMFIETRGTMTSSATASILVWRPDLRLLGTDLQVPEYQAVVSEDSMDTSGFPLYAKFDGVDDFVSTAGGGGGASGFMLALSAGLDKTGVVQTLWSDGTANSGYIVRVNASNNVEFSAGNGTDYTTIIFVGKVLEVGSVFTVLCWHDGNNMFIQVDDSAAISTAAPTVAAGTSSFTIGKDNGAASGYFSGAIYTLVYLKNNSTDANTRDVLRLYCKGKAKS